MKLNITAGDVNITYEDDYSKLEADVTKRIIDIIQSLPMPVHPYPTGIIKGDIIPGVGNTFTQAHGTNFPITGSSKYVGTVEGFFNLTKEGNK